MDFVEDFQTRVEGELAKLEEEPRRKRGIANIPPQKAPRKNEILRTGKLARLPRSSVIPEGGTTVHLAHENFDLVAVIMFGIKRAADSTFDTLLGLPPRAEDFRAKSTFDILPSAQFSRRIRKSVFKDYAPVAFAKIRQSFGIQKEDYIGSLGPHQIMMSIIGQDYRSLRELCSSGKSGSFFYYTADGRFTLKTVSRAHFHAFRTLMPAYYEHVVGQPGTLISRIFGLHKILFSRGRRLKKVYFVIMNNVFNTPRQIHQRFDLKGSTVGRALRGPQQDDPTIAQKDLDFNRKVGKLTLPPDDRARVLAQVREDVRFFEKVGVIDYSLLLGIHYRRRDEEAETSLDGGLVCGPDQDQVLYLGIIDIFTRFSRRKQSEYHFKRLFFGPGISCVPPRRYAARFQAYIASIFV